MEHFFNLENQDEVVVNYLNDLIISSEEINEDTIHTIKTFIPDIKNIEINDIQEIKNNINQSNFQTNLIQIEENKDIQVLTSIKNDKDFKDKLQEQHPYLNKQQILFLIKKYGKKNIETILMIKLSENEKWFDELINEYQIYIKQTEIEQKKEKQLKKSLYEKYYQSIIDTNKTYKPHILTPKEHLTRFRDNKIVSNKGEKFIIENKHK